MRLIFIYGLPATGKHTVAQQLATLTGYKLFHNHLAVDLLLSVFDFGSQPFVELREQIWLAVFDQAAAANLPGLIFTFAPEHTVRPTFIPAALDILARHNATVDFIELTCPLPELKQRLDNPSRRRFQKLTSPDPLRPAPRRRSLRRLPHAHPPPHGRHQSPHPRSRRRRHRPGARPLRTC